MQRRSLFLTLGVLTVTGLFTPNAQAQNAPPAKPTKVGTPSVPPGRQPDKTLVFKKTPQGELKLFVYLPPGWKADDQRPGIVFWFGGGFAVGTPSQFYSQAAYLAARGLVCVCPEYRVKNAHGTGIDKCVEDARQRHALGQRVTPSWESIPST